MLGFVGFGEAGSRIAAGLRESGAGELFAYDIVEKAGAAGVTMVGSNAELAARCSILISVVTAQSAVEAARQNLPHLTASHIYVDCNSVSPATKREIAAIIESGAGRFVEAAVMAPVPKRNGHRVPMLLNGKDAAALLALGFNAEILDAAYGTAAAVKMCRSIVVKGMEAILTECVLASSEFGAEERVFASLQQSFPGIEWKQLADYMVNRVALHGERRAHEMEEVAETLRSVGVEPIMAEATARRQAWAAKAGLAKKFGPEGPATYREVLEALPKNAPAVANAGRGPLNGIRVLDLSAYIAGPYACSLLADLGAEVIKVEPPQGDTLRQYPSTLEAESRGFLGNNRSKLGIVLDLKKAEAQEVLLRMVESADVLVHNFRPGVAERLGIGYEALRARNPRLIYCALTGYGARGPLKDKAGYDQVLQSITGICALQGGIVYGSVVDTYAASLIVSGVTAALYHRERTGEGQHVGVSLLASALSMQSGRFIWADNEGREVGRDMRSGGITGIHPTGAGELYISANTPHFWQALCELIGLPELAADPNYDTVRKRAERAGEIVPKIREALRGRTALEWEEVFGDSVPCGALRPIEDMFDHPQVLAEGLVATFEHPTVGRYRGMAKPIDFSATPCAPPFAAPTLGQHTAEILKRLRER